MARLFPFRSETTTRDGQPRVVDLEGEDGDAVFSALSSTTARRIYARLDEDPGTPSDVADAIDSSIQNVRYHLEKLEDAGLVEIVDTWYSSRGNEMSVYATTDGPLIVTSDESTASQLKTAISRLIGGIGALAGGSLLVQYGASRWFGASGGVLDESAPATGEERTPADDGDETTGEEYTVGDDRHEEPTDAPDEEAPPEDEELEAETADDEDAANDDELEEDAEDADALDEPEADVSTEEDADALDDEPATETTDEPSSSFDSAAEPAADDGTIVADGGAEAADAAVGTLPPGLVFFLGGLAVLVAVSIYWYWYRPAC
ncbi:ArsR family transcriptional regulator [Natrarchaeobius halalkaliphilus]|uniref:ArsR family transcriptional regulator n=1 Tax=Natrarchaeobius halalkaliphilus TaxID=1679091 RepID=A0A3N6NWK0_9EURY|nr:helix-turn-helix domain-containing protein [Natrarchaeobius halalkaliphilus]RQG88919.1 ArsR family transcriptional regulator [Natrarchaeobius halalkaliphilus]